MALVAGGAGILFAVAVGSLALFFRTNDERLDRIAEWGFVGFAILAGITILAVPGRLDTTAPVDVGLTVLGIAAVAAVGLGELGTTLRLVDFRRIAMLVTLGFVGFLAWIGAVSVAVVFGGGGRLPAGVGWLGLFAIVLGLGITGLIVRRPGVMTGDAEPDPRLLATFALPMAAIVAWLVWLGLSL